MKREIEKFPYGTGSGLSETEAKENFVNFCKEYGPLTLRIGLFALMMSSAAFAADTPGSGPVGSPGNQCAPTPAPNSPKVLPATKELVGIAACLVTITAKACNKL